MYRCVKICFTSCEQIIWIVIIVVYDTHRWHRFVGPRQTPWSKLVGATHSESFSHLAPDWPDWHCSSRQTACGWSKSVMTTQSSWTPHEAPGSPDWHLSSRQTAWSNSGGTTQSDVCAHHAPGCPVVHSQERPQWWGITQAHTPCWKPRGMAQLSRWS